MKITVIDDDKILSNFIKEALEHRDNHHVTVINKVSDAIAILPTIAKSEVVILDLMMRRPDNFPVGLGEETGEALFRAIKKENRNMPIIIITGKEMRDIGANINIQKNQVLMKPLDPNFNDLSEAINNVQ